MTRQKGIIKPKLVVFDLDGVIFEHDNFYSQMHERYSTEEKGRALERKYLKSNTQKLAELVIGKLWAGKSDREYWSLIEKARFNPGAEEAVAELKRKGIKTMILTSAVEDLARKAQKELGIDYVAANWMETKEGKITGRFRWRILWDGKGLILEDFCRDNGIRLEQTACVGDNENDVSMMRKAGLSIAFNTRSETLKEQCDVVIDSNDLREILKYVS